MECCQSHQVPTGQVWFVVWGRVASWGEGALGMGESQPGPSMNTGRLVLQRVGWWGEGFWVGTSEGIGWHRMPAGLSTGSHKV